MKQFDSVACFVHEHIDTAITRVASHCICHNTAERVVALAHVGRLGVPHIPHAVVQTKHGRSMLGLSPERTGESSRPGFA